MSIEYYIYIIISYSALVRDWVPFPPLQKIVHRSTAECGGRDWDAISTIASQQSIP